MTNNTTPLGQDLIQSAMEALVNKVWNDAIEACVNAADEWFLNDDERDWYNVMLALKR